MRDRCAALEVIADFSHHTVRRSYGHPCGRSTTTNNDDIAACYIGVPYQSDYYDVMWVCLVTPNKRMNLLVWDHYNEYVGCQQPTKPQR